VSRRISVTEAARGFSGIVDQVRDHRAEFLVERDGTTVCRIVPAGPPRFTLADLAALLDSARPADRGFATAVTRGVRDRPKLGRAPRGR
jgi:antitoxin (DNA-binding transcriptional repressor) of toxin-antitoxin stability system